MDELSVDKLSDSHHIYFHIDQMDQALADRAAKIAQEVRKIEFGDHRNFCVVVAERSTSGRRNFTI